MFFVFLCRRIFVGMFRLSFFLWNSNPWAGAGAGAGTGAGAGAGAISGGWS